MGIDVVSYWETNTILISLDGTPLRLHEAPSNLKGAKHGDVKEGSAMISLAEAKHLLKRLENAIKNYEDMDVAITTEENIDTSNV